MLTGSRSMAVTATALTCVLAGSAVAAASPARPLEGAARQSRAALAAPAAFKASAGHQLIKDLKAAWQITQGRHVTVAVIAGGVDGGVTGLKGKVTQGPRFGSGKAFSKVEGTVFASAVAGAGPSSSNAFGTLGLAPGAKILSLRVPRPTGGDWEGANAKAIRYAVGHGAQVIFMDEVGYFDTLDLASAVQYAATHNVVVIGNEYRWGSNGNAPQYPNSLPGVIGAGAAVVSGMPKPPRHFRIPQNESIVVTSPSNELTATGPGGQGYVMFNNLAAAAWLTATAALLKSVYPKITPAQVERALAVSARYHPRGGYNTKVGFGLINPVGALRAGGSLLKLRASAAGAGVMSPTGRLQSGPPPGVINAVHHSSAVVDGSAGVAGAGVLLLLLAVVLPLGWRRKAKLSARSAD